VTLVERAPGFSLAVAILRVLGHSPTVSAAPRHSGGCQTDGTFLLLEWPIRRCTTWMSSPRRTRLVA